MEKKNCVFIATSLDGYISDKNGGIDWLHAIPNPDKNDMGYSDFMSGIDALVMGRKTFETVLGFGIEWPYDKPVFVLSNSLNNIPKELEEKVELVKGSLKQILNQIHKKGYYRLYIDGGSTIQSFLNEDLIDEMQITTIPILLGGGAPLFSALPKELNFDLIKTEVFLNQLTQSHYKRKS
jgi:dihydrofolate reductase